jgi:sterol desaturase/sphingolipid hydroxylase (fatty acid hydroxylase superfamily)
MAARLWVFGSLWIAAVAWGAVAGELGSLAWVLPTGFLLWTAIEYLMHRYAFHGFAPHWEHHESPAEEKYILAPFPLSLSMSAGLWILFWVVSRSLVLPGLLLTGIWIGYLAYEGVHLRIHSTAPGGKLLRALRRYHYRHHFANDQICYGVTSPFWDVVFRTDA